MSYSSDKKHKLIFENWRRFVSEDADPKKMPDEDFPMKLSDVGAKYTKKQATKIATGGKKDGKEGDDKIPAGEAVFSVKELKPSQSSMNIHKAMTFAIGMILKVGPFKQGPGGALNAIISKNGHIMDGHHRWIASGMVDPSSSIKGEHVMFPAKQLIAILNVLTLHFTGKSKGKKASGGFDQFTNEELMLKSMRHMAKTGTTLDGKAVWPAKGDPAIVVKACEMFTGEKGQAAVDSAARKMFQNASQLTLSLPSGFPTRPDMPMISAGEGHVKAAVQLLKIGAIDVNPTYAQGAQNPGNVYDKSDPDNPMVDPEAEKQAERERKMRDLEENRKRRRRKK